MKKLDPILCKSCLHGDKRDADCDQDIWETFGDTPYGNCYYYKMFKPCCLVRFTEFIVFCPTHETRFCLPTGKRKNKFPGERKVPGLDAKHKNLAVVGTE